MDLDAEMERLRKEARAKLDAERGSQPEGEAEAPRPDADLDAAAVEEARRLAARPEGALSLGGKVATVLVGLLAAWAVFSFVVAPLLKLAFVLAILGAVVWVIIALMDDDEDEAKKAP